MRAVGPVRDLHATPRRRPACPGGPRGARRPRAAPSRACARSPARRRAGRTRSGVATLYGQVGDEHPAARVAEQRRPSRARIASASTTVTAGSVGDDVAQRRGQPGVDLDRGDRRRRSRPAPASASRARRRSRRRGRRRRRRPGGRCGARCSGRRRSSGRGRVAGPGRAVAAARGPPAASGSRATARISTWIGAAVEVGDLLERRCRARPVVSWSPPGQMRVVHRTERPLSTLTTVIVTLTAGYAVVAAQARVEVVAGGVGGDRLPERGRRAVAVRDRHRRRRWCATVTVFEVAVAHRRPIGSNVVGGGAGVRRLPGSMPTAATFGREIVVALAVDQPDRRQCRAP